MNFRFLNKTILFLIFFCSMTIIGQEKGSISGKVIDKITNEELIGANILIVGTSFGASTDLDGIYSIKNLTPGKYQLRFSYISYQTILVDNVIVEANKEIKVDVSLTPASTELEEVVVTAEALRNSEANILKIQKNSFNIVDGISAELISKNNSSDGTDVLKSMTGVTISEGKFAYIRGVSDRYNNTLLNGSSLPSTEPEKRSFSYDIFPANLIENVITAKTFTPDNPADFSGGLVQIKTVEFPTNLLFDFSVSTSYNTQTTLKSFTNYNGGNTDWLGIDDGTRDLPSIIDGTTVVPGNFKDNPEKIQEIGKSFNNNWGIKNEKAPINGNFKLSFGNKYDFGKDDLLGFIASLTYSSSFNNKDIERNLYDFEGPRVLFNGSNYSQNIMWGGLLNISYKFSPNHKISLKNIYNRNSDNETTQLEGRDNYNSQLRKSTALRFVSRSLFSSQLIGENYINLFNGVKIDWMGNYSKSTREEPDARVYYYWKDALETDQDINPWRFLMDPSFAYRFYGNLDDKSYGGSTDIKLNFFENRNLPTIKVGILLDKKERNFDARFFGFRNKPGGNFVQEDSILQGNVDQIFTQENINPQFIEVVETTRPSDKYDSRQDLFASYLMSDFTFIEKFKMVIGFRYEYSNQKLYSSTTTNAPVNISHKYNDILPSVNLTYLLSQNVNVRLAYSKTLARPEFRELAPFSYFDFISYETVQGNPNLKRSLINNYDFRIEYYSSATELIAVSLFYKNFKDPIEEVLTAASQFNPVRSFTNALEANNYGLELEVRRSFGFISELFQNFSFVGNLSLIHSEIKLAENGTPGFQESKRAMQGQADFILNTGLYYDNYNQGFSASIVYNRVGEKIAKAGFANLGDVVEKPRDQIDISLSQKLLNHLNIKFIAKDILAQDHLFIQKSPLGDKVFNRDTVGRNYSIGLSYQF
ncbi:MAG: TonB-dependent receptor [Ignavibacterium sp.]